MRDIFSMVGQRECGFAVTMNSLLMILVTKNWIKGLCTFAVSHITATIPKTGLRKLTPGMSQMAPAARTPNVATSKMHSFRDAEESVVGFLEILSCRNSRHEY
jgi:hypothetical protein